MNAEDQIKYTFLDYVHVFLLEGKKGYVIPERSITMNIKVSGYGYSNSELTAERGMSLDSIAIVLLINHLAFF